MKIYYKNKILISGMFPMTNFSIDGYTQKMGKYNENILDVNNIAISFYIAGHLTSALFTINDKSGNYYEYFENSDFFKIEISDELFKNKIEMQKYISDYISDKVGLLEKKLHLITNIPIGLPIYQTMIYDANGKLITFFSESSHSTSFLDVNDYDDKLKNKLFNRLRLYISDESLINLEEKNVRFKRAFNFFNNSFISDDIGTRFTLLFSSLEALFNLRGENVKEEISKYASKILFLSEIQRAITRKEIKKYYRIRSNYIHGNKCSEISEEFELNLREYVREVLIIYWNISMVYGITIAADIIKLLNKVDRDTLDVHTQLFIKYLRTDPKKFKELYSNVQANFLNKDYSVLSNKTL